MSEPDWLNDEDKRAEKLTKTGKSVSNPTAPKAKRRKIAPIEINRSLKGFRLRVDYQQLFDELVVEQKHTSKKNGPVLIEEALEMLFKKYNKLTF